MLPEGCIRMETYGCCKKCQAPVFLNQTTDWYGNTVVTLNCWNGHYKWIHIEDLDTHIAVDTEVNVVSHLSFFNI